jgi:RNA polymerase sigma factor (sigma-70 family)
VAGDHEAVATLVARYDRPLRSLARSYRLQASDMEDVVQATWLQFLKHGAGLREPAAVSGWLMTTARRACLRVQQAHVREHLAEEPWDHVTQDSDRRIADDGDPVAEILAGERRSALAASLNDLNDRQRQLMTLLVAEPDLSYEEIGRRLGLPIGSIGPTRARSLALLRRSAHLLALR